LGWDDWIRGAEVEPSLYAADFGRLGEQIRVLLAGGARIFHFDVGDGYFVPPITFGPIVLKSISEAIHAGGGRIDCHLMVFYPERHLEALANAGADSVTVHAEACGDRLPAVVEQARALGLQVGLAFNPETAPERAAELSRSVDFILCMSIHPGYGGQEFMPDALRRISRLRELVGDRVHVQVDGGIGAENARDCHEAGADLLVAGTSIFGAEDPVAAYRGLVDALR